MGRALPGHARSTVMSGLRASTSYDIKLQAGARGRNTQPLLAVAVTGTTVSHDVLSLTLRVPKALLHTASAQRVLSLIQRMSRSWGP